MGSRSTRNGAESAYRAAEAWIDHGLRSDDSLFTPGIAIWSRELLGELHSRFLERPDESKRPFLEKLQDQMQGSPPQVYQLMGEILYVHYILLDPNEQAVRTVLEWSPSPVSVPPDLSDGLQCLFINLGQGRTNIPFQIGTLIETVEQWKELETAGRQHLLSDPWEFKDFLFSRRFQSRLMVNNQNTGGLERHLLLHLVFPDTFEPILRSDKQRIAAAGEFSRFTGSTSSDPDQKIREIREGLEAQLKRDFGFYDDDVSPLWRNGVRSNPMDVFVIRANEYAAFGRLDSEEVNYKLKIGYTLAQARDAVLGEAVNWQAFVKRGISGNLVYRIQQTRFRYWIDQSPGEALLALQALWTRENASPSERIREFCRLLPRSVISGLGSRAALAAVLMMGLDPEQFPPYRVTVFNSVYNQLDYPRPDREADEAAIYEHALLFLDRLLEESSKRGLRLRHRLDAQSLVWVIAKDQDEKLEDDYTEYEDSAGHSPDSDSHLEESNGYEPDDEFFDVEENDYEPDFDFLAERTYLPTAFLESVWHLLQDKKQVIFQGPPGTGKTYIAQELAEVIAELDHRVTLVQFHPSYAYEDFVQGYRPRLPEKGQAGFEIRNGPLLQAAERARREPRKAHFLVIDEINRGNLAKVFGELYFLLEYRDREIRLQYSDEKFSLPENLYLIGTMNTADRSIALVDLALRRRFYFVDFHPDRQPVEGLLRRYLKENAPTMEWVAEVVDLANSQLREDRHAAIGPSYFMRSNLNENDVSLIWEHSVLPYIEERLFGYDSTRLDDFALRGLRRRTTDGNSSEDDDDEPSLEPSENQ